MARESTMGLIGRKAGMTRVFTDEGASVPVTVIEVLPNRITAIREEEADGYRAIQITTGSKRAGLVNKPTAGTFRKAGVEAGRGLWEFRLAGDAALPTIKEQVAAETPAKAEAVEGEPAEAEAAAEPPAESEVTEREAATGDEIKVDLFEAGQFVDVTGTSIGKGFAGAIKRHNFSSQRMSHGNSLSHRAPGSIGQNQTPGRVFKGKKMAGQLGNTRRTVHNLQVVRVDADKNLLLVKGGVPGAKNADLIIRPAVKKG